MTRRDRVETDEEIQSTEEIAEDTAEVHEAEVLPHPTSNDVGEQTMTQAGDPKQTREHAANPTEMQP